MSYLQLSKEIPNLKKAVISLWFRVPKTSADRARRIAVNDPLSNVMNGVVPFITWGEQPIAHLNDITPVWTGAVFSNGFPILTQSLTDGFDPPLSPSYIGVFCGTTDGPLDPPKLDVRIQTKDFATGAGRDFIVTDWSGTDSGLIYNNPLDPNYQFNGGQIYTDVEFVSTDVTNEYYRQAPDFFGNSGNGSGPDITFNKWHHLLISWDLDGRNMWCAVDDVNKKGADLPALNDPDQNMGPNKMLSNNEFFALGSTRGEIANLNVSVLPTKPVNLPGPAEVDYLKPEGAALASKEPVCHVELAELQIWSGKTTDTGVLSNRRYFIDKDGEPVDPEEAEKLLGKPHILLHGTSDWQDGRNTGSLGFDDKGDVLPSGQFVPVGRIDEYTPDPSLHGDQGKPQ
jgi:hypothetical protein